MIILSSQIIENPVITVIVPSYNRANTIVETIDSILCQICSYEFEIVIGDDFSSDESRQVLKNYQEKYPKYIKLIFQEQNIGLGANWATCVKNSRGRYIAGCDNDDFWHYKDKLQIQIDFLEGHPEYGMVHTDYRTYDRSTGYLREHINHKATYSEPLINVNYNGKFKCCNSSVVYRSSVIFKHVNLDDYVRLGFPLQDWNTWVLIAKYTKFHCLPFSTTTVGIENESITRPKDYEVVTKRFEKEKIICKYLQNQFPDDLTFDEDYWTIQINRVLLNVAYLKSDFSEAVKFARYLASHSSKNMKTIMAFNRVTFMIYSFIRKFRKGFNQVLNGF